MIIKLRYPIKALLTSFECALKDGHKIFLSAATKKRKSFRKVSVYLLQNDVYLVQNECQYSTIHTMNPANNNGSNRFEFIGYKKLSKQKVTGSQRKTLKLKPRNSQYFILCQETNGIIGAVLLLLKILKEL
jgi:hypothetical protein